MRNYTKKPVTIEAIQYICNEKKNNINEILEFCQGSEDREVTATGEELFIKTLEGTMRADNGDYIIKGIKGEFYPCKPDIFESSYTFEGQSQTDKHYLSLGSSTSEEIGYFEYDDFANIRKFVDSENLNHIGIDLQSRPISEVGVDGMQIDDAILVIAEIIKSFNSRFPCRENSIVITKLEEAHLWCLKRKIDREKRGVEGKNIK